MSVTERLTELLETDADNFGDEEKEEFLNKLRQTLEEFRTCEEMETEEGEDLFDEAQDFIEYLEFTR